MDPSPMQPSSLPRPSFTSPVRRLVDRFQWFGVVRSVAVALSVLCVGAGGYWLLRTPSPPVESALPFARASVPVASGAPDPAPTSEASDDVTTTSVSAVVVHVAGSVLAPGVYRLSPGARVIDAIAAAGGVATDADVDVLNEAALLRDGERVYVPAVGEAVRPVSPVAQQGGAPSGPAAEPAGPIDLNAATADQLDTLPGVGPATAAAIIAHRDEHGPFASVDDLGDVRGIGPAKLEALRDLVRV